VHPDLAARKVIVNAYMYYVFDRPILSDAEYDRLSEVAAAGWDQLHPDRQWALGSPEDIRASGFHIKFSSFAVAAARTAFAHHFRKQPPFPEPDDWKWCEDRQHRYVTTGT
jgi:NAD-dependent DNA ligase